MKDKEILVKIGDNIRRIRKEKNKLQQDLAAECNMEIPNLSRIENGRVNLTVKTLYKISIALKVEMSELIKM